MEHKELIEVDIGGLPYRAERETTEAGMAGHITIYDPLTERTLGRVVMAVGGAMTLETPAGPLPRAAVEWLLKTADEALVVGG